MSAQTAKCQICVGVAVRRDGSIDMRQALSDFAARVRDFAEGIPGGSVVNDCDLAAATARAERAEAALIDAVGLAEDLRYVPDHGEPERHRRTQRLLPLQRLRDALVEGKAAPPERGV